ncbi:hypothetical protein [Vagococcus fluvialis]|jgi:hypothetical protein|uniref:Uncharacterized protein n=1 Tax=Vagococcus fluvialis TaxID=2738 RepID=A0A369ATZ5_9ENTE|nr:hypothetical protein [Vagococcus fluvialis]MDR2276476.1 hypothetical protein [Vagococcus sp.]MBO0437747.1 hypothetical protein [Vagococcus fluvialis]NKC66740.1 hypothetical protein [Vagococcus fluvialis]RCX12850.1 hypothetical protein DFR54_10832 [Vagococcus fluvialis]RSU01278.1 hypothetical protein CBF32_09040 [Vagococcus fluvialis]
MSDKKLLKSERIRLKNDELRAKGKDPLKGWGKMIDTGLGGINKAQAGVVNNFDNKGFIADQQKEIARENDNKRHKS